jgi:hypothetical protein
MLAATMQAAAPQVNSTSPPSSTRLRPKRSDKPPYATVKKAIDSIASDIVSWAMPVETPNPSFTADMAGMKMERERPDESDGDKRDEEIPARPEEHRHVEEGRGGRRVLFVTIRGVCDTPLREDFNVTIA